MNARRLAWGGTVHIGRAPYPPRWRQGWRKAVIEALQVGAWSTLLVAALAALLLR